MPPVVAVCPVHDAFQSNAFVLKNSTNITLEGNSAFCPICGRESAIMDGTFDFDELGFATVLSSPEWSREALEAVQGKLQSLKRVLANDSIPAEVAEKWVDRTLSDLRVSGDLDHERLADLIASRIKGKPRPKALAALMIVLSIVGGVATIRDGAEITTDLVQWIEEQAESGVEIVRAPPERG